MAFINKNVSTMAMPSGMNRMGQFPLDMSSVYYDEASLKAYAESGSIAYVGQIVSLVDETNGKVTVYSIQNLAGDLKEVGTVPVGDEKTIDVDAEGKISLANIESLVFERDILGEDEEPTGEKEEIKYQALLTKDGLVWVEPSKTTVEGLATLIDGLSKEMTGVKGRLDEIEEALPGFQPVGNYKTVQEAYSAEGSTVKTITKVEQNANGEVEVVYSDIAFPAPVDITGKKDKQEAYSAEGSKVKTLTKIEQNENGVIAATFEEITFPEDKDTTYTLGYEAKVDGEDGHPARIVLTPSEGEATYVDATPFIKDGMLDNVAYDADSNTLTFTFNTDAGKEDVEVELSDILAPYTGVDGDRIKVEVSGTEISADLKVGTITKDYLDANVQASLALADSALQEHQDISHLATKAEVTEAEGRAAADASSKAATAKSEAITEAGKLADAAQAAAIADADTKLANKVDTTSFNETINTINSTTGTLREDITAINNPESGILAQAKADATEKANAAKSGAEATAAGLYATKEYVGTVPEGKGDTIVAYINKKAEETLAAAQGGSSETAASVAAALQNYKDLNDPKVQQNTTDIAQLRADLTTEQGKITNLQSTTGDHATKIGVLENTVAGHGTSIEALNTTTGTHGTDIADLKSGKADKTALTEAVGRISANETAIDNRYTKEEANALLADKADKSSVYTKSEADNLLNAKADASAVYTKEEINATVATLATKTELGDQDTALKALITAEETRATGKEAELLAAIQKNAEDIGNIDFIDETELAAAVEVETNRAVAKENELAGLISANSQAIAGNTAAINSILGNEDEIDLNSIAELAAWITEHGTEAEGMTEAIEANAAAIKVINETTIPGAITSANGYTDDAIAVLAKTVGDNKTAIEGTVSELANTVAANKKSADDAIAAITTNYKVKDVDGTSLALNADGVASVKAVSTDLLTQGSEELVFCAGNAGVKAAE